MAVLVFNERINLIAITVMLEIGLTLEHLSCVCWRHY